jgi:CRP-like cAMP-binding protein
MKLAQISRAEPFDYTPCTERLRRLGQLDTAQLDRLAQALYPPRRQQARSTILTELHQPVVRRALLAGWAGRVRILADGRRQLVELFVPGDLIEMETGSMAATDSVVALTDVVSCAVDAALWQEAPFASIDRTLSSIATRLLRNQIMRLGRQSAYERLGHLLLELRERQAMAGLEVTSSFPMPLTQEMLAETLGLTTVHLNRTMQQLRRESMVRSTRIGVELPDPDTLARITDYVHFLGSPSGSHHAE